MGIVVMLFASQGPALGQSLEAFTGNDDYVGGQSEREALKAAIERCVAPLGFVLRPIARSRLNDSNQPPAVIGFRVESDRMWISRGPGLEWTTSLGHVGHPVVNPRGFALVIRRRFEAGTLIEEIESDLAQRVNRYRLLDAEGVLEMQVEITTDRFPLPLIYRYSYARRSNSSVIKPSA